MDENTTPYEANLVWTLSLDDEREFIGKTALAIHKERGITEKLVGLALLDKGILRVGQEVLVSEGSGIITSGGFSPTLNKSIAFARIPVSNDEEAIVKVRDKELKAKIVKPRFLRRTK